MKLLDFFFTNLTDEEKTCVYLMHDSAIAHMTMAKWLMLTLWKAFGGQVASIFLRLNPFKTEFLLYNI
jgi:hypothetical protein